MIDAFRETYLGDGLYASFDGWRVRLRAPRIGGDHWVALEPPVIAAFLDYLQLLKQAAALRALETDG